MINVPLFFYFRLTSRKPQCIHTSENEPRSLDTHFQGRDYGAISIRRASDAITRSKAWEVEDTCSNMRRTFRNRVKSQVCCSKGNEARVVMWLMCYMIQRALSKSLYILIPSYQQDRYIQRLHAFLAIELNPAFNEALLPRRKLRPHLSR